MSVVMHDSSARGFRDSSDERYRLRIAGGVASRSKTWKNHSQDKRSACRRKACWSTSSRGYRRPKTFESKAAALREAYLAAVLEIHEVATSSICYSAIITCIAFAVSRQELWLEHRTLK